VKRRPTKECPIFRARKQSMVFKRGNIDGKGGL
jgi:hypothetical protein